MNPNLLEMLQQMFAGQQGSEQPGSGSGGGLDLQKAAGLAPGSGLEVAKAFQPMDLLNLLQKGGGTLGMLGGSKPTPPPPRAAAPPAAPSDAAATPGQGPEPASPTAGGGDFMSMLQKLFGGGMGM